MLDNINDRKLDLISLSQFLSFEYVPAPRTAVKDIQKLSAGHFICYSVTGISINQYWNPSFQRSESHAPVHWKEYKRRLINELKIAVSAELVSDVPIGILLSGGLDSSAIAAIATQESRNKVSSFSLIFNDPSFYESRYSRLVAKHLNLDHHELEVGEIELTEALDDLPNLLDEPLADSSLLPSYLLAKFARNHVKVVLGGDGGDELFAGYPTILAHQIVHYYELLLPLVLRRDLIPYLVSKLNTSFSNISFDFKAKRFLSGRGYPLEVRHHRWMGAFLDEEKSRLIQAECLVDGADTYATVRRHLHHCDARSEINRLLYLDLKLFLEGDILSKVDRASMACSLEARVPFLNPRFVEFVTELPSSLKMRGFTAKFLLKKALSDLLPTEIVSRPKKGFNIPLARYIASNWNTRFADILLGETFRQSNIFNDGFVQGLLSDHSAGLKDNRKLLWTLYTFEKWRDYNKISL